MRIEEIREQLKQFETKSRLERPEQEISFVKFYSPENERGFENEIYVASAEDFPAETLSKGICNLVLIGKIKQTQLKGKDMNVIFLDGVSVFDCINLLSDILEKEDHFQRSEDFLEQVQALSRANKYDFNEIMEIIYELLGNPFSIIDTKGGIINYRQIYDINEYLSGVLQSGGEVEMTEEAKGVWELVSGSFSPVLLEVLLGEKMRHIINKITINGKTVAFFFVAEINAPLSEKDFPLIEMICQWISVELQKNRELLETEHYAAEHFLTDMLNDNFGTKEEAEKRASLLRISDKPYHYIAVTDLDTIRSKKLNLDNVRAGLKNLISGAFLLTYKDAIVLYLNTDKKEYLDSEKKKAIEDFCRKLEIHVGISYIYSDLTHTHQAYVLADEALKIGSRLHPDKVMYEYQDYMLYHVTKKVSCEDDVKRFCHPKLMELIRYDAEHNTEYTYTLYMLLLSAGKKVVAADELHVHRSTLLYRLEKIDEITGGIDVYDTPTIARLYLSFALLIERGILNPAEYSKL